VVVQTHQILRAATRDRRRQSVNSLGDTNERILHAFELSRMDLQDINHPSE
jgi:hypothetical protein